jgi:hypothetical protein
MGQAQSALHEILGQVLIAGEQIRRTEQSRRPELNECVEVRSQFVHGNPVSPEPVLLSYQPRRQSSGKGWGKSNAFGGGAGRGVNFGLTWPKRQLMVDA